MNPSGLCACMTKKPKPNWRTIRFEEMAEHITDKVDVPSESGVERYVGLEHLDPDSLKIRRWGVPTDVEATKLRFKPGDIIFGRRRAYQRKLAVADFEGICSAHALVLRAHEDVVLKEFLPFFMQSETFFERALSISVGSLSPTINWKTLAAQEFSIPPLDEQRRIAELLWAADEALEKWTESVTSADQLHLASLENLVLRGVNQRKFKQTVVGMIPTQWEIAKITEAGEVKLGRQRAPKYQTGDWTHPYLRVANVFDGYLDLSDVLSMDFGEKDFQQYALRPGDILLAEGHASKNQVGRSCIYRGEIPNCCFQNTLVRFRASSRVLSGYAHAYFQYLLYSGAFAQIANITSIAHLGSDRFSALSMPIPPLAEQQEIVKHLDAINQSRNALRSHLEKTSKLKNQLLKNVLNQSSS